jgi:hypothetical protein
MFHVEFLLKPEPKRNSSPGLSFKERGGNLELERFKALMGKTIKAKLSEEAKRAMYKAICDPEMGFVEFEKFNRLCDVYFFTPGIQHVKKNDSHQIYQILSSMQRDRPLILTNHVSPSQ